MTYPPAFPHLADKDLNPLGLDSEFFEGKKKRINHEFNLDDYSGRMVVKIVLTDDSILTLSDISIDQGGLSYRIYTAAQVAESGTFADSATVYSNNILSDAPTVPSTWTFTIGGDVALNVGVTTADAVAKTRLRSASSNSARSSVLSKASSPRGYPAGTYYAVFEELSGVNNPTTGVWTMEWTQL